MFPLSYQLGEITHDFKPTLLSLKTCFHKSWHRSVYTNEDQSFSFCISTWSSIGWCLCILKQLTSWCMILQFMFPLSYQLCEITHDFKPTSLSLKTRFHRSWHCSVYTNGDQSSSFCVSNWSSIWSFICIMKQFTNTISYYTSYIIYHHIIIYLSIYLTIFNLY